MNRRFSWHGCAFCGRSHVSSTVESSESVFTRRHPTPNKPMDPTCAMRPRLIGEALGGRAWCKIERCNAHARRAAGEHERRHERVREQAARAATTLPGAGPASSCYSGSDSSSKASCTGCEPNSPL